MTRRTKVPEFKSGQGFTKADWDSVESSPLNKLQLTKAKPFVEVFPELAEEMRKNLGGRPLSARPKLAVSIRLDQDVVEKFKASGPGWQSRINEVLKQSAG
jgi:uncharacterized protein (DUF4415 family)